MKLTSAKSSSASGAAYRMAFPAWRPFTTQAAQGASDDTITREELEGIFKDVLRYDDAVHDLTSDTQCAKTRKAVARTVPKG